MATTCSLLYLLTVGWSLLPDEVWADCAKQGPCSCQDPNGLIDLSPLDGRGSAPKFKDQKSSRDSYLYSWNPCSPFSELSGCSTVSGCQVSSDYKVSYPIGTQDTATFNTDSTTGDLTLSYQGTDSFRGVRYLAVTLLCDPTADPGTLTVVGETNKGHYSMSLSSIYCCPNSGPGPGPSGGDGKKGLSIGSIMVIVFFALLLMYVVLGVVFQKYVRKASGKEMVPNVTIWSALPGLVKKCLQKTPLKKIPTVAILLSRRVASTHAVHQPFRCGLTRLTPT